MDPLVVKLTKAERATLTKRDVRYRGGDQTKGEPFVVTSDHGPTIDWPNGVRKTKHRLSAEAKILAALAGVAA